MRTLGAQELGMVSGGVLPVAVIGAMKVGGGIATGLATLGGLVYLAKSGLETGAELCKSGANVSIRTPKLDISCTAPQRPARSASSPKSAVFEDPLLLVPMQDENYYL
jgi:lactobin A/cerein 7B family class IIb bacteriocin